ncbi:MAG: sensor histidine kinase [Sarcina sp.]
MKDNRILGFKYIFLLIFAIELLSGRKSADIITVVLIAIIFSNIRRFYLEKEELKLASIFIELLTILVLSLIAEFELGFYLVSLIGDFFYFRKAERKILLYVAISLNIKDFFIVKEMEKIFPLLILLASYILINYIYKLNESKKEAQLLYDRIRVSEEELKRLNRELETYSQSVEELSILKERNRISREIHDGVGHVLSTTMIQLSAMERVGKSQNNMLGEMAGELRNFVSDSFQDVKKAVRALKPDEYSNYECLIRVNEFCKNIERFSGISIKMTITGEKWTFSSRQGNNIYRIAQEVLSNAVKHSRASKVDIIIKFYEDELMIVFKDDGVGTNNIVETGVGLKSIKERISELSGNVQMKSEKGKGMFTKLVIPRNDGGIYGED